MTTAQRRRFAVQGGRELQAVAIVFQTRLSVAFPGALGCVLWRHPGVERVPVGEGRASGRSRRKSDRRTARARVPDRGLAQR